MVALPARTGSLATPGKLPGIPGVGGEVVDYDRRGLCLVLADHAAQAVYSARALKGLIEAERRATTGRTAVALAHDVGKELGLIRMLARRLPTRLDDVERCRRDLGLIQNLAGELTETVRSFVEDSTRTASDEPGTVSLDHMLSRVGRAISRIHGDGRINESIVARLRAVRVQESLERVLLNLLDNAILASEKADPVHVFATMEDARTLQLTIRDRGCGIPGEAYEDVFRLGFTTRAEAGGSGIGLAVSREIMEALGGSIWLEPNPGGGTVASVRVPVASLPEW